MASDRIPITQDMLARLMAERQRTGVSAQALLSGAKDKPSGLNSSNIQTWLRSRVKSVRVDHYEYALSRWQSLPDKIDKKAIRDARRQRAEAQRALRVTISDEILQKLRDERDRTGLAGTILSGCPDMPDNLTPAMVSAWLSGTVNVAIPAHTEFVLKRYAVAESYVEVNNQLIAALNAAREHLGGGWKELCQNFQSPPPALNPNKLSRIVNGRDKRIPESVANYLSKQCAAIINR